MQPWLHYRVDGSKDEDPDRVMDNPPHDEPGVCHPVGFGTRHPFVG
jgi:hypothetical protein